MPGFTKNPLFLRASKATQSYARREWQRTDAAKAVGQVRNMLTSGKAGGQLPGALHRAARQWSKSGWNDALRSSLMGSDFGSMVNEVQKYARMGGSTGRLLSAFLGELGPVGSLIRSVIGATGGAKKGGLEGDINSALSFLDAVAPETISATGRRRVQGKQPTAKRSAARVAEQIEQARAFLEAEGYEVKPTLAPSSRQKGLAEHDAPPMTDEQSTFPGGVSKITKAGRRKKVVDLDLAGSRRRFPVNHPIVTKEMIRTPESSNVYAYSYDLDNWTMHVRFQSPIENSSGPGPLYAYHTVPPKIFLSMYQAPSKGTFIWDEIRIRGTVSGHHFDYRLEAVRDGYVPRKATMTPAGEMYLPRTVQVRSVHTGKISVLKSGGPMRPQPFGSGR